MSEAMRSSPRLPPMPSVARGRKPIALNANVGKIGTLELFVVGNIEEYALLFRLRHSNGAKRPPDPKILIEELASASGLTSQLVMDAPALFCSKSVCAGRGVGANQGKNSLCPLARNA